MCVRVHARACVDACAHAHQASALTAMRSPPIASRALLLPSTGCVLTAMRESRRHAPVFFLVVHWLAHSQQCVSAGEGASEAAASRARAYGAPCLCPCGRPHRPLRPCASSHGPCHACAAHGSSKHRPTGGRACTYTHTPARHARLQMKARLLHCVAEHRPPPYHLFKGQIGSGWTRAANGQQD